METKFKPGDLVYIVEVSKYETNISMVVINSVRFTDTGRTIYFYGATQGVTDDNLVETYEEALKKIS